MIQDRRLSETEAILDALPYQTFAINSEFRIVRLNRAALKHCQLENYSEAIGNHCYRMIHGRDQICPFCPYPEELSHGASPGENNPLEKIIQVTGQADGERTLRLNFYPVDSSTITLVETVEDITQQRENQEETLRIENLAALGTMVSGIVHELNNPLTGMGLTLQNLEANLSSMEPDEIKKRMAILRKDLIRSSRIVSDILSFTRPGTLRLTPTDITQTIERAKANILRLYPVLSRQVEWIFEGEQNAIIPVHPEKMERLFINLFRNSIQALDYSPGYIKVDIRRARRYLHIMVEDNAGGIGKDTIKKIFNPFFSSSTDSRGSGLGLTICHSIVKEHNGRIRVRSFYGITRFYVSIPLQNPSENA